MIIWLASYPKSGNTFVRSMLSSYFYSKDGSYDFNLIKNIKQFPHGGLFQKLGIDIKNQDEVIKNYIRVQDIINKDSNSIKFFKTHSFFFELFTNLNNTLGVIYIVRDPRNVIISFSNFMNMSMEKSLKFMTKGKGDGLSWIENWSKNYNSWKVFKEYQKYLLIKYEDLIQAPDKIFLEILEFIHKLNNKSKIIIDEKKFKNTIKSTRFENLQKLEKEKGFPEAHKDQNTGEIIPFFNMGQERDWRKSLDKNIIIELEKTFNKEMKELGYL